MYENENNVGMRGGSAFTGFVMGALVGAGIALLMAPATGTDTRKRLRETAQRLKNAAGNKLGDAQTTIGEIRDDAKSAFMAGREAYTRNRQQRNPSDTESPFATDPANPRP
jgi:gas vesicle protein